MIYQIELNWYIPTKGVQKSENEQMKIMWRLYYIQFPKYILGLEKNIIQCFKTNISLLIKLQVTRN